MLLKGEFHKKMFQISSHNTQLKNVHYMEDQTVGGIVMLVVVDSNMGVVDSQVRSS